MEQREARKKMRISFRGNDEGAVMLLSVILILLVSLVIMSYIPYSIAQSNMAAKRKSVVVQTIESENREVMERNELY